MDINQIIEQHALWLDSDGEEGARASLYGANLTRANLTRANLTRANLTRANLTRANLYGANLYGANLTRANLTRANLYGANLTRASLYGANLTRANLTRANLYGANLYGANLYGANLTHANLYGASGNLNHLKSVFCDTYPVTYTAEVMQIGCQRHKLEDWWNFDDKRILEMDGKQALKFWRIWKPILQQIIATSPATATGYVENTNEN
ncbi:MAG: pentapeptide repeat-containing protein [Advenella sp.]|nr:pentapeptide repeat-containing protein [Advenella sp.]